MHIRGSIESMEQRLRRLFCGYPYDGRNVFTSTGWGGLSPKHSIVIFDQDEPIAVVMNGFRIINGKKTAWNGGTGISPAYRGKGVSRLLMEETLAIYKREHVEIATLEAIKENQVAIALYEKYGYEVASSLLFLSGEYGANVAPTAAIHVATIRPEQLAYLSFYQEDVPWQCGWQSVKQGKPRFSIMTTMKP